MKGTLAFMVALIGAASASAAPVPDGGHAITLSDFGPAAVIEDYENTGLSSSIPIPTPRTIRNATYTTDDHKLRYAQFGPDLGSTGFALGTNTTLGFLDITLHEPVYRAGLLIGLDLPWAATASFFDTQDLLLGEIFASGTNTGMFVGWQSESRLIRRIRITDTADPAHIIAVDNLYTELVPEPSTFVLAIGTVVVLAFHHRNRQRQLHWRCS
jgi:hypothetical protein